MQRQQDTAIRRNAGPDQPAQDAAAEAAAGNGSTVASSPNLAGAALWMGCSATSFIVMAIAGREAAREIGTIEIMLLRGLMLMPVIVLFAALSRRGLRQLATRRPAMHGLRSLFHFGGQFCWFFGLPLIPLSQVFALEFTTPIWIALLAPLLIGERMTGMRLLAVVLGFLGVLIVVRPDLGGLSLGTGVLLASALGYALSSIVMKRIILTESPLSLAFYLAVWQTPLSIVLMLLYGPFVVPGLWTLLMLAAVTLSGLSAHYGLARAYALADAMVVAPMDYVRLPLVGVIGMLLYAEPFELDVLVGGLVILAGNLANIAGEHRRRSKGL